MLLFDDWDELSAAPDEEETTLAMELGAASLDTIDATLLKHAHHRWRKAARVVLDAVEAGGFPLSDETRVRVHVLSALFPAQPGVRAVIRVRLERVATSCGYAVPRFEYKEERDALAKWCEKKGPEGLERYKREKNEESIDGLPGLRG